MGSKETENWQKNIGNDNHFPTGSTSESKPRPWSIDERNHRIADAQKDFEKMNLDRYGKLIPSSVQVDHNGSYAKLESGAQIHKFSSSRDRQAGVQFPIGVDLGNRTDTVSDHAGTKETYQNGVIYTKNTDGLKVFIPLRPEEAQASGDRSKNLSSSSGIYSRRKLESKLSEEEKHKLYGDSTIVKGPTFKRSDAHIKNPRPTKNKKLERSKLEKEETFPGQRESSEVGSKELPKNKSSQETHGSPSPDGTIKKVEAPKTSKDSQLSVVSISSRHETPEVQSESSQHDTDIPHDTFPDSEESQLITTERGDSSTQRQTIETHTTGQIMTDLSATSQRELNSTSIEILDEIAAIALRNCGAASSVNSVNK